MIPFDNKQQQQMNRICRNVDTFLLKTQGLKKNDGGGGGGSGGDGDDAAAAAASDKLIVAFDMIAITLSLLLSLAIAVKS